MSDTTNLKVGYESNPSDFWSDTEGVLQKYAGKETAVQVPDRFCRIGEYAFAGNASLTRVYLPSSVVAIEAFAFHNCANLVAVEIPEAADVDEGAFVGCDKVKVTRYTPTDINRDFKIENGVLLEYLGDEAVVRIPDYITKLEDQAFAGSSVREVIIPSSVTVMRFHVFRNCLSLERVEIPGSIEEIGYGAFQGCTALRQVTIAEGVKTINGFAFRDCAMLEEIKLPKSLVAIQPNAFAGCIALTKVDLPESSKGVYIGDSAFAGCTAIKELYLPQNVIFIGKEAFKGWTKDQIVKISNKYASHIIDEIIDKKIQKIQLVYCNEWKKTCKAKIIYY